MFLYPADYRDLYNKHQKVTKIEILLKNIWINVKVSYVVLPATDFVIGSYGCSLQVPPKNSLFHYL